MQDVKSGTSFGTALKKGAKSTYERGKQDFLRKLDGSGKIRKTKTHKKKQQRLNFFSC